MPDEVQVIEGRVRHVVFSNTETGFAVVSVELTETGRSMTVAGALGEIHVEDLIRATGEFDEHPRFGRQFKAVSCQPVTPSTLEGIRRYLRGPRMKGIGPELARRLVESFGTRTLEILDAEPDRLHEVPGIGKTRIARLVKTWQTQTARREGLVFLQGHGIGPAMAERVLDALGEDAVVQIRANPYTLVERVSGIGFRTADGVGQSLGQPPDSPDRIAAGLDHALDVATTSGHACLPGNDLLESASDLLDVDTALIRDVLKERVRTGNLVIARPDASHRDGAELDKVYLRFLWEAEREAGERLRALIDARDAIAARVAPHLDPDADSPLTDEQRDGVRRILGAKVSVLTGGPGVGKTTVVRTLVEAWRRAGLTVGLACPTGRAAKRLEEVVGATASTIHRLLEYDGHRARFARNEKNPLEHDIVVVDETSMLDLPLFLQLVRAVPLRSRLVLVGDADQLPSVGPGRVLRDLIDSGVVPVARLTQIFRQGARSGIVELAHGVLAGRLPDLELLDGPEVYFIPKDEPADGADVVRRLLLENIPRRFGFDAERDIQILAPMHKGPVGTVGLNRATQLARNPDGKAVTFGDLEFRQGDRVIQVRNDYDRDLYNGDVGRVVRVDPESHRALVTFDGEDHEYTGKQLRDLQLAWAISVHKSQGGEYPAVILPLFPQHFMMLQRQVSLYGRDAGPSPPHPRGEPQGFSTGDVEQPHGRALRTPRRVGGRPERPPLGRAREPIRGRLFSLR